MDEMSDTSELLAKGRAWAARGFCDPTTREFITALADHIDRQDERIAAMREALKPFADAAFLLEGVPDTRLLNLVTTRHVLEEVETGSREPFALIWSLRSSHFRQARSAYKDTSLGGDDVG